MNSADHTPLSPCAFVTLTGWDEATCLSQVEELSALHQHRVEWGVLLGYGVGARYPSIRTVDRLATTRSNPARVRMALHLCGQFARAWVEGDPHIVDMARQFDRIQLNLNLAHGRISPQQVREAIAEGRHDAVITQHYPGNASLTEALLDCPHHALLFDQSGGRGHRPARWPQAMEGKVCGYAGGLGPGLMLSQLPSIALASNGPFWVDMESSLRTDDRFDLSICSKVLEEVSLWRLAQLDAAMVRCRSRPASDLQGYSAPETPVARPTLALSGLRP